MDDKTKGPEWKDDDELETLVIDVKSFGYSPMSEAHEFKIRVQANGRTSVACVLASTPDFSIMFESLINTARYHVKEMLNPTLEVNKAYYGDK